MPPHVLGSLCYYAVIFIPEYGPFSNVYSEYNWCSKAWRWISGLGDFWLATHQLSTTMYYQLIHHTCINFQPIANSTKRGWKKGTPTKQH